MAIDRRKLLKAVPAGVAAAALSDRAEASEAASEATQPTLDGTFDVAVVGAGVAGCYVAYRLLHGQLEDGSPLAELAAKNGGKLSVGLFEYAGRVGGRLLAAEIPLPDDPSKGIGTTGDDSAPRRYAEFGGFRFQPQMHIVRDVAKLLDLEHEPFPVDEPPENPIYLRRKRFLRADLPQAAADGKLPYKLRAIERETLANCGDFDTFVANRAFARTLPDGPVDKYGPKPNGYTSLRTRYQDAFRAEDWQTVKVLRDEWEEAKQVARVDGRLIPDWSWWSLMTRFLSSEAIAYSEDSGGYNSLWSPGNVPANLDEDFYFATPSDAYPHIYGPGSTVHEQIEAACEATAWKHIDNGYSDIPNRLYKRFLKKGGQSFLGHQLLSFNHDDDGYVLRFFQRQSGTLTTAEAQKRCLEDPASCRTYGAKFVILALPKRSLELLDQANFMLANPTVQQLLNSVLNVPATRFFIAYERPWWTEAENLQPNGEPLRSPTCGRSTTDLRVRQFYYWHTATDGGPSFVLGSYTNGQANFYWRGLQNGPGPFDRLPGSAEPVGTRHDAAQGKGPRAATDDMVRLAHRDLVQVVGPLRDGRKPPKPYYGHFQDWDKDPWGGGWHAFTAGNDGAHLIPRILQPLPDENVYLCGECYSNIQGWVQGALNTSEVMLQKKLGLAYPTWLSPGGTWLGPGSEGIPTT